MLNKYQNVMAVIREPFSLPTTDGFYTEIKVKTMQECENCRDC